MRRFLGDRSAVSAIEFALLLPIMIATYIALIEVSDGMTVKRKADAAATALSDLVARVNSISPSDMENIFDATEAVIQPFGVDRLRAKASCVVIDSENVAKVAWSVARRDSPDVKDTPIDIPDGVNIAGSKLVIADLHYAYTPLIGEVITGEIDIRGLAYFRPREDNRVCYGGDCC